MDTVTSGLDTFAAVTTSLTAKERLLQTGLALIWNSSYESVGVNEICTRAGVTKGCFYHHFASKSGLFCAAAGYYWQESKPLLDGVLRDNACPYEQLKALILIGTRNQILHANDDNPVVGCPFLATAAQIGHREPEVLKTGQQITENTLFYLEKVIAELQRQDFAYPVMPSDQAARLVHQYYQGAMIFGRTYQRREAVHLDAGLGIALTAGLKQAYREDFTEWFKNLQHSSGSVSLHTKQ